MLVVSDVQRSLNRSTLCIESVLSLSRKPAKRNCTLFFALQVEKVLDMLANLKIEEAEEGQEHKAEILSSWQSMETEDLS